jgi:hypothetical protein
VTVTDLSVKRARRKAMERVRRLQFDPQGIAGGVRPLPNPTPGVALPNSGFNAKLQPNDITPGPTSAFSRSFFAVEGIRTFHGDGTGTVKGTAVGFVGRPTPGPDGFPDFPPSAEPTSASRSPIRSARTAAGRPP